MIESLNGHPNSAQTPTKSTGNAEATQESPAGVAGTPSSLATAPQSTVASQAKTNTSVSNPTALTEAENAALEWTPEESAHYHKNIELTDNGFVDNRRWFQYGGNPVKLFDEYQAHLRAQDRQAEIEAASRVREKPASSAASTPASSEASTPASSEEKPGIFKSCWNGFGGLLSSAASFLLWLITGCGCFSSSKEENATSEAVNTAASSKAGKTTASSEASTPASSEKAS